jgi:hypothetical protein
MLRPAVADAASSPEQLAAAITEYLLQHPAAAVLEDGRVLFDLPQARYSLNLSHGRCVLQFWSDDANLVRTVIGFQKRAGCLRLTTRKMGHPRPLMLELTPTRDRRTPTARETERRLYIRLLERALQRRFPEWKQEGFRAAIDLEHSFGPAYARGMLLHGANAEAVIGVGGDESSATIDGVLTLGLLWLDYCREHSQGKTAGRSRHFGGLKVIVPEGSWRTAAERMVWLHPRVAGFELYALSRHSEELTPIDVRDCGNARSRLVHAVNPASAIDRAAQGIGQIMAMLPAGAQDRVEIRPRTATDIALAVHGLEFAHVRHQVLSHSFAPQQQITFGAGANETELTAETEPLCRRLLQQLFLSRHADGDHTDSLFRLQPERWLESRLRMNLASLLPDLRGEFLYSQVPAISAGDRGMLDLLAVDRQGRLAVLEIKADEDLHLPLQGLDYWIRVQALNANREPQGTCQLGEFERQGYFPGLELSTQTPRLLLIAPALRIHPANATVLRYLSTQVDWELIAVSEHWRRELKIVFRKRSSDQPLSP